MPALLRIVTVGWLAGRVTNRRIGIFVVHQGPAHFEPLAERCVDGEVQIHIDRVFGLDEVRAALDHHGSGRALGKVVVQVA